MKEVNVPFLEEKCVTKQERKCNKHWEERGKGRKVWVDNPLTCQYFDVTDCQPIAKEKRELKREKVCNQLPSQHCDRVIEQQCRVVPKQTCNIVPYQDCKDVVTEVCKEESYEHCDFIPVQKCRVIHEKIPKQVTVEVPVRDCSDTFDKINRGQSKLEADQQKVTKEKVINDDERVRFPTKTLEKSKKFKETDGNDEVKFNNI